MGSLRNQAKTRDDNTCQKCGRTLPKKRLEAHHIHPQWADGPDELDNLVTLCKQCHKFAPEKKDGDEAREWTEIFLSSGNPPPVDLFLLGVEWAILSERTNVEAVDKTRDKLNPILRDAYDDDDIYPPNDPSQWYDVFLSVVETERALNEPSRVQTPTWRKWLKERGEWVEDTQTEADTPG